MAKTRGRILMRMPCRGGGENEGQKGRGKKIENNLFSLKKRGFFLRESEDFLSDSRRERGVLRQKLFQRK